MLSFFLELLAFRAVADLPAGIICGRNECRNVEISPHSKFWDCQGYVDPVSTKQTWPTQVTGTCIVCGVSWDYGSIAQLTEGLSVKVVTRHGTDRQVRKQIEAFVVYEPEQDFLLLGALVVISSYMSKVMTSTCVLYKTPKVKLSQVA